jgi:hypothetical protein
MIKCRLKSYLRLDWSIKPFCLTSFKSPPSRGSRVTGETHYWLAERAKKKDDLSSTVTIDIGGA